MSARPVRGGIGVEPWEFELLQKTARRIRTFSRDELEAELARYLLLLKRRQPPHIRNWRAFITTALRNKAFNWIRDQQARERPLTSLDQRNRADDDVRASVESIASPEPDLTQQTAAESIREALTSELRNAWDALILSEGNQAKAAGRLGIHRNTVRARINKIRQLLIAHGFQPSGPATPANPKPITPPVLKSGLPSHIKCVAFSVMPVQLLQVLLVRPLSGTQWRILLWVIRQTSRRKERTIRFRWAAIARTLSLNRATTYRAGQALVRTHVLYLEDGRVGLRRG